MLVAAVFISFILASVSWSVPKTKLREKSRLFLQAKLVLGINKYSHDASICIADSETGKILFSQAKERITGRKHDGGAVGKLINYGIKSIGASVEDISVVVSNNHHFRVIPFEKQIPFYSSLNYVSTSPQEAYI